ncbi:MAG TPA: hypothetical protein VKF82_10450 [Candidatus Eremiobacteraceae bacterium]|nr:hypothetical protein [Candidatus Eremiobacteraceae bacterium]
MRLTLLVDVVKNPARTGTYPLPPGQLTGLGTAGIPAVAHGTDEPTPMASLAPRAV